MMSVLTFLLLGMIPAALIFWIGSQIRSLIPEDQWAFYWLRLQFIMLACLLTILVISSSANNRTASSFLILLLPVTSGIVASISLQLSSDRHLWSGGTRITYLLILIVVSLLILLGITADFSAPLYISIGGIFTSFIWKIWGRVGRKILLVWSIQMLLLCISIWVTDSHKPLVESPDWLSAVVQLAVWMLIPIMGVTIAAGMVYDILSKGGDQDLGGIFLKLTLVISIFSLIGYQIFTASVWDVATDGLGGIFTWMLISISAIAIAMVMAWRLPDKEKLITLIFALIVPLSLRGALWAGSHIPNGQWGESPSYITERRAATIANAVGRYYEAHGYYPPSLNELVPANLVYLPKPIMIPGQTWCYEGGVDYFRFGYVYRQYFSTPASVKIHADSGEPPSQNWSCEDEAAKYPAPAGFYDN